MRSTPSALLSLVLALAAGVELRGQEKLTPGTEGALEVPGCTYPCVLYVPSDYKPGLRWPLIFFLHGAGGKPTSWPWKSATGGVGYLVAGLSYGPLPGGGSSGIQSDPKSCLAMVEFIDRVRELVDDRYGVDRRRVFLSGLSMGGWGTNFYGFLDEARGRYRGYCIMAAGLARGPRLDLSVLEGLPLLLLNGEKDPNLPAAQRGKPIFEKAGALVTQVVLPGEGHVPSIASMAAPLKSWLDAIAKEDERSHALAALSWSPAVLEGAPARGGRKEEALATFFGAQKFVQEAAADRPILIFCSSAQLSPRGAPTRAARECELVERRVFAFPEACATPAAARFFTCFKIDLSAATRKESPLLHEALAPLVLLLDRERSALRILTKGRLRDATLAAELGKLLSEEERLDAAQRCARLGPILVQMRKVLKAIESEKKTIARYRRAPAGAASKRLARHSAKLEALQVRYEELRGKLGG